MFNNEKKMNETVIPHNPFKLRILPKLQLDGSIFKVLGL